MYINLKLNIMRTLLYSFGFLTLLVAPVTCNIDAADTAQSREQTSTPNGSQGNNVNPNRTGIDPVLIPTKP